MRFKYGVRFSDLRNFDTRFALVILSVGGVVAGVCGYRIDQLRGVPAAGQLTLARIGLVIGVVVFFWGLMKFPLPNYLRSSSKQMQNLHRDFSVLLRTELERRRVDSSRGLSALKGDLNDLQLLRPLAVKMVAALPETDELLVQLDDRITRLKAAVRTPDLPRTGG
jgi:hypothetical protein